MNTQSIREELFCLINRLPESELMPAKRFLEFLIEKRENIWTGVWETQWSNITMIHDGNIVTGTYPHENGRMECTVSGNILRGRYSQDYSKEGEIIFSMNDDGKSFTGKYTDSKGRWKTDWNGKRIAE